MPGKSLQALYSGLPQFLQNALILFSLVWNSLICSVPVNESFPESTGLFVAKALP